MSGIPGRLPGEMARTGRRLAAVDRDPVAGLVVTQPPAAALGAAGGLDPDNPRHPTRSGIYV
ncbi:hypothetical protein OHT57_44860 [Streptomyces sp. NBC_00285]|uniref:hypothetical protein n=1 Tax=Streptomyces sp. NBC_00285 TaxID=2975700 RepID=UPI002E2AF9D5|nr:hypothetical protein [Streptomyces sp. NBC_00285]